MRLTDAKVLIKWMVPSKIFANSKFLAERKAGVVIVLKIGLRQELSGKRIKIRTACKDGAISTCNNASKDITITTDVAIKLVRMTAPRRMMGLVDLDPVLCILFDNNIVLMTSE